MTMIAVSAVNEGIAIAADCRITHTLKGLNENNEEHLYIGDRYCDHDEKIFVCENNCVITTTGDASFKGKKFDFFLRDFMKKQIHKDTDVKKVPELLISFFHSIDKDIDVCLFVAGYDNHKQKHIYEVFVKDGEIEELDVSKGGISTYNGQLLFMDRLLFPCNITYADGSQKELPSPKININTLDDAVSFCKFVIEVSKQIPEFLDTINSVGGETEILVIKEDGVTWLQKAELI